MTGIFDNNSALKDFAGRAPVFPLPNVVLFPHAILPLHIFEPRYRKMIDDVLRGDRLIALARLKEDYSDLYHTKQAPVYESACLGRVTGDQKLKDGRYYLYLEGIIRTTILNELETEKPYRVAELKIHRDRHQFSENFDAEQQTARLLELCRHHFGSNEGHQGFLKILESTPKLGTLCDLLSYACPISVDQKQALLEERRIEQRSELLVKSLVNLVMEESEEESFPPRFSLN